MENNLLENLNKEQLEAVTYGEGPFLIVAGAGTGKTTVLTKRIAYLILEKGLKPDEILALTFTEKAAREMEERVDVLLPYGFVDLWISTFHSFCDKILKQHALDIGLSNDYKLLTETDQWILIRSNFDKFNFLKYYRPLGNSTKFISGMIRFFSRLKDEGISTKEFLEYAENLKLNKKSGESNIEVGMDEKDRIYEMALSYDLYERLLNENNSMDFGGLINNTLRLFNERPYILEKYRNKFKYVLIDEFQDTNLNQYELIKFLASPKNNITAVGDDDQAIYKFRGASLSNILNFKKDFPNAKEVLLNRNYRSSKEILDLSYEFIKQNDPNRLECQLNKNGSNLSKKLIAKDESISIIEHIHSDTLENEVKSVINRIVELKEQDKDSTYGDFAILSRSNASCKIFSNLLSVNSIPNEFLASSGLYAKDIILDVMAYLRILDKDYDNASMYRILSMPILNIEKKDIISILFNANKLSKPIIEICKIISTIQWVSPVAKKTITNLVSLIEKHTNLSKRESIRSIIKYFLIDYKVAEDLTKNDKIKEIEYINKFSNIVEKFEDSNFDVTLPNFLNYIELIIESGDMGAIDNNSEDPDTVKVMTVHSSKGLEFKYVFIINLVDKKFPSIEKSDPIEIPLDLLKTKEIIMEGDPHIEEERRLFYVAMTRAKKGLFLTSSDDYGGKVKKKISRFLEELKEIDKTITKEKNLLIDSTRNDAPEIKKKIINFLSLDQDLSKLNDKKINYYHYDKYSFTQLEGYKNCPLQYKFQYILRIPMSTGRPVFSYGQTMHGTLQEFYKRVVDRTERKQVGMFEPSPLTPLPGGEGRDTPRRVCTTISKIETIISLKELLKIYDEAFIEEWYESDKQKEEYREKGRKSLRKFYNDLVEKGDNIIIPKFLEQGFTIKVGEYFLKGKIDRIDVMPDGSCEIIDYKTGESKDEKDVKKEQLYIYQIAATEAFNPKLNPTKLSFYYLDDNTSVSFLGKQEDLDKFREKMILQIEEIRKNNFDPKPSPLCKFCDFRDICEYRSE